MASGLKKTGKFRPKGIPLKKGLRPTELYHVVLVLRSSVSIPVKEGLRYARQYADISALHTREGIPVKEGLRQQVIVINLNYFPPERVFQ